MLRKGTSEKTSLLFQDLAKKIFKHVIKEYNQAYLVIGGSKEAGGSMSCQVSGCPRQLLTEMRNEKIKCTP
jgi:CO dehydrogenase nickel-insertion accessory protein CooC1